MAQLNATEKKSFVLDKALVHLYDWSPVSKCTYYSEFSQLLFNNGNSVKLFTHVNYVKDFTRLLKVLPAFVPSAASDMHISIGSNQFFAYE